MGVMPLDSAAITIVCNVSGEMAPCSKSISTHRTRVAPNAISTICGDGIITERPNTGCPAANFSFILLGSIYGQI